MGVLLSNDRFLVFLFVAKQPNHKLPQLMEMSFLYRILCERSLFCDAQKFLNIRIRNRCVQVREMEAVLNAVFTVEEALSFRLL